MPLTIRYNDEEAKIIETLKKITGEKSGSSALISGAKLAIKLTSEKEAHDRRMRELEIEASKCKRLLNQLVNIHKEIMDFTGG
ncbi:hypothetical protein [Parabacteroides sp. PF5-9]|uniref:hypothetical protein n=1 Tax=Parabacteroides sp. PF5-9 TaxID=1742404 RepID=UPI00247639AE|nr:hypothetical protein [Parabacteroides sp. PF5-9]MDH6358942.1 hypothetical protein [Parabacteroides sp. PF5-9]